MKRKKQAAEEKHSEVILKCIEDFRPNEARDLIITAVQQYLDSQPSGFSRRRTLCEAIIKMNEKSNFEEKLSKELAAVFKNEKGIDEKLPRLGFIPVRSGKHHCFRWADQTVTVSASPSDHRSGKNEMTNIKNKIFVG